MKKIFSIILCLLCIINSIVCFAANDNYLKKIEQIYSKMPEINVYVHSNSDISGNVKGYISEDELSLTDCKPFDREEGISYIFMFDCSTSVTNTQMEQMKNSVVNFINKNTYNNDKYTIVSFGKTIDVLADGSNSKSEIISAVKSMKNNQTATVLFDAVSMVKKISENADDIYPQKRMCVVFTDAVDYTVGGTTRDELLNTARVAGAPIYVVAINPSNKESIDVLGQVARASGGEIKVATNGNINGAFLDAVNELNSIYKISFMADTNVVLSGESDMRVWIGDECLEHKFVSTSWTVDDIAPYISSTELVSDRELRVFFSEKVRNANASDNYTVKKGISSYTINTVLYDDASNSAILIFDDYLGKGIYSITVANIVDKSMEKNPLTEEYSFEITGFRASMINFKNFFVKFWWAFVILAFLIAAFIMLLVIKKRKGIVLIDNKATFGDNIKYETVPAAPLPTHYLQLAMEMPNGSVTNLDINIVQSIIFGRAETCEVTIDDGNMSRQHFAIELENGMLFIQNLSQTNGTLLNGIALQSKRKLSLGDVIMAGQEKFTVNKI